MDKILFVSFGALGDALHLSYLFPIIKRHYPDVIIDVLIREKINEVFASNPFVRRILNYDFLGGGGRSTLSASLKKIWRFVLAFRPTVKVLNAENYDYYIDIRASQPCSHFFLPFVNVKKSIGFNVPGFRGLMDAEYLSPMNTVHNIEEISALLKELNIDVALEEINPQFYPREIEASPNALLEKVGLSSNDEFILIFPESIGSHKILPDLFWKNLIHAILDRKHLFCIISGVDEQTHKLVEYLRESLPDAQKNFVINAVKAFNINELARVVPLARYCVTLDSFPAHFCSIYNHTISFYRNCAGFSFFPVSNYENFVIHNDLLSKDVNLDSLPKLAFSYTDNFENPAVITKALEYIGRIEETSQAVQQYDYVQTNG